MNSISDTAYITERCYWNENLEARKAGHVSRRGSETRHTCLVVRDLVVVCLVTLPVHKLHSVYCRKMNMSKEYYWNCE